MEAIPMPSTTQPHIPTNGEIVDLVESLRKENGDIGVPKLLALIKVGHSWQLSEKRLRSLLNSFNLSVSQRTYAHLIRSQPTGVKVENCSVEIRKARGKGLYILNDMSEDSIVFQEDSVLFVPSLTLIDSVHLGTLCTYCFKRIHVSDIECGKCTRQWCTKKCKSRDKDHKNRHDAEWKSIEHYAVAENWVGVLAVAYILTSSDRPDIETMARVNHLERYEKQSLLERENLETNLEAGWKALKGICPSYAQFLELLGLWNLNNIQNQLFLRQSHLNHACNPNAKVQWSSRNSINTVSMSSLSKGQEVTISYINPKLAVDERRRQLRINYGFMCHCLRCKEESK